jgi:hypothetical protein
MSAKVSKIIISIGGDDKTLTLDEARELRNALNDLLGTPSSSPVQIIDRVIFPRPWPRHYGPYWTVNASTSSRANPDDGPTVRMTCNTTPPSLTN